MSQTDHALQALLKDIRACRICVERPDRTQLPQAPNPIFQISSAARICIAGQAPGVRAHDSSMPFNDPSGDRLRAWLGVDRDTFYDPAQLAIVPMGFCFPGYNEKGADLPPRKECARHWRSPVFEALPQLELIILVGGYAQSWHLGKRTKSNLTETVRAWKEYTPLFLPTPHPSWRNNSWLKKNPWFEDQVLPWLQQRVRALLP